MAIVAFGFALLFGDASTNTHLQRTQQELLTVKSDDVVGRVIAQHLADHCASFRFGVADQFGAIAANH